MSCLPFKAKSLFSDMPMQIFLSFRIFTSIVVLSDIFLWDVLGRGNIKKNNVSAELGRVAKELSSEDYLMPFSPFSHGQEQNV